jgi:hypothetical protein
MEARVIYKRAKLYRYNVIIYVGDERSTLNPEWESWHSITSKRSIVSRLNKGMQL